MALDNSRPGRTGANRHRDNGRKQEADERASDIPELEVTVVARRQGNVIATERFSVPLLVTPETAKDFAMALGRHYTKAVNRVIDAVKK